MGKKIFSDDYRKAISVLIKGNYPSLIFGWIVCSCFVFFISSALGKGKADLRTKTQKKDPFHTDKVKTYTVSTGDDLWGIAQTFYGSGYNAYDIAKANNLTEPFTLNENQILIIPSVKVKKPTQGDITDEAPSITYTTRYTVLPGEYLWQIAEKIYGDGNQMGKLIDANAIPYPYNVEEGQVLIVP